jgi:MFS family permease
MTLPPRFAQFLLQRVGPRNDALLGDLDEEHRKRQSTCWYWRQTIAAIVVGAVDDIRRHKLLALRATAIGWLATWVLSGVIGRPLNRFFNGWVLDQFIFTWGSHPFVMLWATNLFFWPRMITVNLISGWIVARLHRRHAGVLLAFMLVTFGQAFAHALSIALLPYANRPNPVFYVISQTLIPPLFILIGAFLARERREELNVD